MMKTIFLLFIAALSFHIQPAFPLKGSQDNSCGACELRFKMPEGWVSESPGSKMRVAQYKLPKADGDAEDASLVVYYFGPSQGGTVDANIDRWISQMEQPGGGSSKAKTETLTVHGLKVTTVDVAGRYSAEMSPGSATHYNKPGFRLRGAVVETPKGFYFAKLVGPEKTVGHWNKAFSDYIKSFEFK
ncbi:MAG: hypothetical protein M3R69_02900 [Acidobacteriota bacterium]|nr:hypothetical protein [Acidobacteriota bacterium]